MKLSVAVSSARLLLEICFLRGVPEGVVEEIGEGEKVGEMTNCPSTQTPKE